MVCTVDVDKNSSLASCLQQMRRLKGYIRVCYDFYMRSP